MKHSDFVSTAARLMEAREPFIVIGPPGGGKTDGLGMAAEIALGFRSASSMTEVQKTSASPTMIRGDSRGRIILTHPAIQDEVDIRGLPGFQRGPDDNLKAMFFPFGFLEEITAPQGPPTVVIADDFGQARLSVQAGWMQPTQQREIEGLKIRDNVTFAFASNRREDRSAVQGMVSALLDRCVCVLTLDVDADELARWLLANNFPPILAAFVRFNPKAIRFDAKNEFEKSSTPRSIAGLGRLLNLGLRSQEVASGAVGPAFATEFLAYCKVEEHLVAIDDILKAPEKAKIPKERDVLYALMAGLAARLDRNNLAAGVTYLERVPPEFAVMVMKDIGAKIPQIQKVPAFVKWARANAKLLGVEMV